MASPGLSEIATTTIEHRSRELRNNFLRNNALIARLNARGRVRTFPGGRTIVEELSYANNQTFQWYSGYQTLNIAPSDTFTSAEFAIRQAALAVSISGLEELQNSGSRETMIDLLASRIENGEDTFLNGLSLAMYGDGSVSGTIGGLQALVADSPSTGTVGGISRDTWAFWRNIAYDASTDGGAAATSANIIQYMTALYKQLVRGRDKPDLIVADGNYWELYHNALVAIQRIATDNTAPDLAGAGYRSLKFMDADVVLDGGFQGISTDPFTAMYSGGTAVGGVPANHMYFLNTKYLHWRPHAERNMVPLKPDRFSVNQDAMVRLMGWAGNMTLSAAFLQGVLKA
jgi:hypothetical protein